MNLKISLLLLFIFTAAVSFSSCAATSAPIPSTDEESETVAVCDGHDIPFEQIRYLAISHRADMENEYGSGIWDTKESRDKYYPELLERVESDIKTYATVLSVSKNYNINLDDEEIKNAIQDEVDYVVFEVYGGIEEYKKALAEGAMTDNFFRFMYGIYYCQNELYLIMTQNTDIISAPSDEDELYDLISEKFYRTTHVYVPFNYGGGTKEESRAKIEDIYSRLTSGEIDFDRARFEGGTDHSLSEDGYYFSEGYATLNYENASRALGVDQISEIIESGNAFYIIKRLPLDPQYILSNIYTLRTQYVQTLFNNVLNEYKSKISVTFTKDIDLATIK